jgi:hypothetical protein
MDAPGRAVPRFPPGEEVRVRSCIEAALAGWEIGEGDVLVTGGAGGGDLLAAEAMLARGGAVRLLLALDPETFIAHSVRTEPGDQDGWERRFRAVAARSDLRVVDQRVEPQAPTENRFERTNRALLNVAIELAGSNQLHALLIWDGQARADGRGGTAHFARALEDARVTVKVIDPRPGAGG